MTGGEPPIFALATAPGRAAVAVLRLSGSGVDAVVTAVAGRLPPPRRASLRTLRAADGAVLDQALLLWMPGPASFTGEDSAELHLHGGPAVVEAVSAALAAAGARPAAPGAFTRRAFANGKLDLTQAEAVADLVDAETEAQRRQALDQLGGRFGRQAAAWREQLLDSLSALEAAVDFPDEDLPPDLADRLGAPLLALAAQLDAARTDTERGRRVREGWRVALTGAPNAGKSSLVNGLLGRDAAIVTPVPGTTRDVLEQPLVLSGYRLLLADTAGLRESDDPVEQEGVRRARAWAAAADQRLWVVDGSGAEPIARPESFGPGDWLIVTHADREAGAAAAAAEAEAAVVGAPVIRVDAREAQRPLRERLGAHLAAQLSGGEFAGGAHLRQSLELAEAAEELRRAAAGLEPELAAEHVRRAAAALDRITGRIGVEDVLGRVFSRFCIGK